MAPLAEEAVLLFQAFKQKTVLQVRGMLLLRREGMGGAWKDMDHPVIYFQAVVEKALWEATLRVMERLQLTWDSTFASLVVLLFSVARADRSKTSKARKRTPFAETRTSLTTATPSRQQLARLRLLMPSRNVILQGSTRPT